LEIADEYIEKANDGRPKIKAMYCYQGCEPLDFQVAFQGFTRKIPTGSSTNPPLEKTGIGLASDLLKEYTATYTLEQLNHRDKLPASVDFSKSEDYLSDEEFVKVFGMDRGEFKKKPKWKQQEDKKRVGLY